MKSILQPPKVYDDSEFEGLAKVLTIGSVMLPFLLIIIFIRQLFQDDMVASTLVFIGIIFSIFIRKLFYKGHLRLSVLLVVVFFTILITFISTFGNGIHDIAIITYPVLIGFSSIVLIRRRHVIASTLSLISICWLVLGDIFNWFTPIEATKGSMGDFIVSSSIILLGGFVAFGLVNTMKNSLQKAQLEVKAKSNEANRLNKQLEDKTQIIYEIHQKVINSMDYIQKLIHLQDKINPKIRNEYSNLHRKIIVIESAHEQLLISGDTEKVALNRFCCGILRKYASRSSLEYNHWSIDIEDHYLSLDDAIYFGLCMVEVFHLAIDNRTEKISLKIQKNDAFTIKLTGFRLSGELEDEPSFLVLDLLVRQLKGIVRHMVAKVDTIEIVFSPSQAV